MANNREYWLRRFTMLQETQLGQADNYVAQMEKMYSRAIRELEKDIASWYQRFADNNQIDLADAQRLLTSKELKELKWNVEEYIAAGRENALDGRWIKELENASARVHISRLESLKIQMQQHIEVLYGNQVDEVDKLTGQMYENRYYHTAYEVQLGINTGWAINRIDKEAIEKVLKKPWTADGLDFSARIWQHRDVLVNNLHTELTHALIRGDDPRKLIGTIASKMGVARASASRLVMTEAAFFASAGQKEAYGDLGIERYEIVATLDGRTSTICQDLDGTVFKMSDYQVGLTAPPFHVHCRTVTAPWFDDEVGYRAARNADGKVYYVPSDLKYPDWYEQYVK